MKRDRRNDIKERKTWKDPLVSAGLSRKGIKKKRGRKEDIFSERWWLTACRRLSVYKIPVGFEQAVTQLQTICNIFVNAGVPCCRGGFVFIHSSLFTIHYSLISMSLRTSPQTGVAIRSPGKRATDCHGRFAPSQ